VQLHSQKVPEGIKYEEVELSGLLENSSVKKENSMAKEGVRDRSL